MIKQKQKQRKKKTVFSHFFPGRRARTLILPVFFSRNPFVINWAKTDRVRFFDRTFLNHIFSDAFLLVFVIFNTKNGVSILLFLPLPFWTSSISLLAAWPIHSSDIIHGLNLWTYVQCTQTTNRLACLDSRQWKHYSILFRSRPKDLIENST